VEDLLDKLPNHEDNPIVKSEIAQRLKAILCKTLKSEIRSTHKCSYDFQVFWETAITNVTKEEHEWRM
jgi:adenine-specific DNA methylase